MKYEEAIKKSPVGAARAESWERDFIHAKQGYVFHDARRLRPIHVEDTRVDIQGEFEPLEEIPAWAVSILSDEYLPIHDFTWAVKKMMEGVVVTPRERHPYRFRIADGVFQGNCNSRLEDLEEDWKDDVPRSVEIKMRSWHRWKPGDPKEVLRARIARALEYIDDSPQIAKSILEGKVV